MRRYLPKLRQLACGRTRACPQSCSLWIDACCVPSSLCLLPEQILPPLLESEAAVLPPHSVGRSQCRSGRHRRQPDAASLPPQGHAAMESERTKRGPASTSTPTPSLPPMAARLLDAAQRYRPDTFPLMDVQQCPAEMVRCLVCLPAFCQRAD